MPVHVKTTDWYQVPSLVAPPCRLSRASVEPSTHVIGLVQPADLLQGRPLLCSASPDAHVSIEEPRAGHGAIKEGIQHQPLPPNTHVHTDYTHTHTQTNMYIVFNIHTKTKVHTPHTLPSVGFSLLPQWRWQLWLLICVAITMTIMITIEFLMPFCAVDTQSLTLGL